MDAHFRYVVALILHMAISTENVTLSLQRDKIFYLYQYIF